MCAIITKENQDVVAVDLPSFFLQTEMNRVNKILLKFTRARALLLIKSNSDKHRNHLMKENRKFIIYILLCSMIKNTLLSCKKLTKALKEYSLTMNLYDPYV